MAGDETRNSRSCFCIGLACTPAAQADEAIFTFHNDRDSDLTELFVGADSRQGWGPELMARRAGSVAAGTVTSISIDDGIDDCNYDVYARWANDPIGSVYTSLNVCEDSPSMNASSGWCSPDFCGDRGIPN